MEYFIGGMIGLLVGFFPAYFLYLSAEKSVRFWRGLYLKQHPYLTEKDADQMQNGTDVS